jgi:hypothetical protein
MRQKNQEVEYNRRGCGETFDVLEGKSSETVVLRAVACDGKVKTDTSPGSGGTAIYGGSKRAVSGSSNSCVYNLYRRELDHLGTEGHNVSLCMRCPQVELSVRTVRKRRQKCALGDLNK